MTQDSKIGANAAPKRRPPNAGKGRPKGAVNKSTASVKAALVEAFEKMGGVPSLVRWAKQNETEFYKLWTKMMPTEVSGPNGGPVQLEHLNSGISGLPRDRREKIREAIKLELEGKTR